MILAQWKLCGLHATGILYRKRGGRKNFCRLRFCLVGLSKRKDPLPAARVAPATICLPVSDLWRRAEALTQPVCAETRPHGIYLHSTLKLSTNAVTVPLALIVILGAMVEKLFAGEVMLTTGNTFAAILTLTALDTDETPLQKALAVKL